MKAQCACGELVVTVPGPSLAVVACHCVDCQRRTGSPFGVGAYYPSESVGVCGATHEFIRPSAAGGSFKTFFCPRCGSSVFWVAAKHPSMIGVAVGAFADPGYPGPVRSVWEQTKHAWVSIDCAQEHFERGREG